ncbi:MAG: cbb3-type cytochrome c oxidase subunit 3 [Rhodospirillales bacterium]|nr:cbb3-type cytochrome c oxidase subunit 3 [Rhodospirillales bacterium]
MDYDAIRTFAATWGLVALVVMFAVAVAYALWPRNRAKFRDAANIPLKED